MTRTGDVRRRRWAPHQFFRRSWASAGEGASDQQSASAPQGGGGVAGGVCSDSSIEADPVRKKRAGGGGNEGYGWPTREEARGGGRVRQVHSLQGEWTGRERERDELLGKRLGREPDKRRRGAPHLGGLVKENVVSGTRQRGKERRGTTQQVCRSETTNRKRKSRRAGRERCGGGHRANSGPSVMLAS
ncbi:hypothetical protein I4F81_009770 [Pyropia yezoensis]|uniref:Uncharacterized protein n=1 Tax=Pyropia yezoensis TaxID=2788 RepID=A0ACC3CB09_PYRYE|nr:hypothetical protein I4F81_009770 [Neopyropia yezoensis]